MYWDGKANQQGERDDGSGLHKVVGQQLPYLAGDAIKN
jgi:hypothetical protein